MTRLQRMTCRSAHKWSGVSSKALALALLALGCLLAYRTLAGKSPLQFDSGGLFVPQDQLALGEIWETDHFTRTLTIQNTADREIHVEKLLPSCACFKVLSGPLVLPPGGSANVPLVLNLAEAPRTQSEINEPSKFAVSLFPMIAEDLPVPRPWTFTATLRFPFAFDRPVIDFGEVFLAGSEPVSRTVRVHKHADIREVGVDYDKSLLDISFKPPLETSGPVAFEVTPRRNAQPGPHQGRIKVTGKASQGQRVVSECRFGFISLPDLHPVPSIIVGEPRPVGSTLSETVVISSRSRKSIEIIGFDPDSDAIRVASANRTEDGLPMLNVTVAVCELGQKAYQLKVHLRCKTSKLESTVTIPVHVYGVRQPAE